MSERWLISKEFEFDFGHRVWTQSLNPDFSLTTQCVCKRLHGHRGKVKVYLTTDNKHIYDNGMVTDFKHLQFFKKFIDDFIDHRFLIDINDPFIKDLEVVPIHWNPPIHMIYINGKPVKLDSNLKDIKELEKYTNRPELTIINLVSTGSDDVYNEPANWDESFVICNFVPTAENIAKFFYQYLQSKFKDTYIKVEKVVFYETPKSEAIYIGDDTNE